MICQVTHKYPNLHISYNSKLHVLPIYLIYISPLQKSRTVMGQTACSNKPYNIGKLRHMHHGRSTRGHQYSTGALHERKILLHSEQLEGG